MSRILVTGATGFLGQEVVRALLARNPRRELVLLIRAADDGQLNERLGRIGRALPAAAAARLRPLRGDVCLPRLGLDAAADASLCREIDHVVHVAASTRFDHPLDEARRRNVGGTQHVLDLCLRMRERGRTVRLDHVSTAYVAGTRTDLVLEDDITVPSGFRNTYEQSKWEAEHLLRRSRQLLPIVIHRPSIIVGSSSSGSTTRYHGLYEIFGGAVRVYGGWRNVLARVVPLPFDPDCSIDLVPVDYVSAAIATLLERDDAPGRVYHLAAGAGGASSARALVERVCAHFAVETPRYVRRDGVLWRAARAAGPLAARLAPQLHRRASFMLPYTWSNPRFDVSNARAAGLSPPSVADYFGRILDYAYANRFGPAAARVKHETNDGMIDGGETIAPSVEPARATAALQAVRSAPVS